jgi:hypothetical protein
MEKTPTSKGQDLASTVVAIVIAAAALALIGYSLIHVVSILKAVFFIALGFVHAFMQFLCSSKWLKKLGAKPWMNNKWTWLAMLVLGAIFVWSRGDIALWPASCVLFLRLFITPDKPAVAATATTTSTTTSN